MWGSALVWWYGIDLFEFGISTVQCTTWEDPNDIDTQT